MSLTSLVNDKYQEQIDKLQKKIDSLEQMLFKYNIGDVVIDKDNYNIYEVVALIKNKKKPSYQCKHFYFNGEDPCYSKDCTFTKYQDDILCKIDGYRFDQTYREILKAKFVYKWLDEEIKAKFECKY